MNQKMDPKIKAYLYQIKQEYPDIFKTEVLDQVFIFRPLTKYEFEEVVAKRDIPDHEITETVCEFCTLWPAEYDFEGCSYAGIPESLCNDIIKMSGFANDNMLKGIINRYRQANDNSVDRYMENVISVAYPTINPDDIKDWDFYKIVDYFTRAEWIIENMMTNYNLPKGKQQQVNQQQGGQQQVRQQQIDQQQVNQPNQMSSVQQGKGMGQSFRKNR